MTPGSFQELLAVNWFDGLLVSSRHLSHVDGRMDALISQVAATLMDQPGLVGDESNGSTANQLIEIESQSITDTEIEIQFNITRHFQAISPAGQLLTGIPNKHSRVGIPTTTLAANLDKSAEGEYLVCVRQSSRDDLNVQDKKPDDLDIIELKYPSLEATIIQPSVYEQDITGQYRFYVPIGRLGIFDGELQIDNEYIPPICRLELVASFDTGLLSVITGHLQELQRVVYNLVQSSVLASVEGDPGVDFLSRRADYGALNAFLLGKLGMVRTLGRTSPYRMLFELVYPLAAWWKIFHDNQFKPAAGPEKVSVSRVTDLANQLTEIAYPQVCSDCGQCLYRTKEFLEALNTELGIVG